VEAFDVLGDPVRRRILELLARGDVPAGTVADAVGREFGISQPAVSQHLRVLRESGFANVRADGSRRLYSVNPASLDEAAEWIVGLRRAWEQRLDALGTELARGARRRRAAAGNTAGDTQGGTQSQSRARPGRPDRTRSTRRTT
jgi:DNA-binding transcriptional ArsR family regulator